ncbi:MAG: hypothetical protein Q9188_005879 [Gyalolechia gomerana]
MDRQAVITLEGDILVIDLPNAVLRLLLPSSISVYGAHLFPRHVDLDRHRGRISVEDVDDGEFISYEEKGEWTMRGLQEAAEISQSRRNVGTALEDGYGIAGTECTDTPVRGRSPTSRARNSGREPADQEEPDHEKSESLVFTTPRDSPQIHNDKRKASEVPSPEPLRRASGPIEVPVWNTSQKAMRASERYDPDLPGQTTTPPWKQTRRLSSTPGSRSSDRFVKGTGTITPQEMSWKRRRVSITSTQRSLSSYSETRSSQNLAKFHEPWRIPGTQPIITKHTGMTYFTPPGVDSSSNASEASINEETTITESDREPSPTARKAKSRNSEAAEFQKSAVTTKTGTQKADQLKRRKEITPPPKSLGKSKGPTVQTPPIITKDDTRKADKPTNRTVLTILPTKPVGKSGEKPRSDIQGHQAKRRKSEGTDTKLLTVTTKVNTPKADKPTNRKEPIPPLSTKPMGKSPVKLRSDIQDQRLQPQPPKPASAYSKQIASPATKNPQGHTQDHHTEIVTWDSRAIGKGKKRPAPSPIVEEHPSPTAEQPEAVKPASSKEIIASSDTKHLQVHTRNHGYENPICIGNMTFEGKKYRAPPPLSITKARPPPTKGHQNNATQVQGPSPNSRHLQHHHTQNQHHQKAASDRQSTGKGQKRPALSPSPNKEYRYQPVDR